MRYIDTRPFGIQSGSCQQARARFTTQPPGNRGERKNMDKKKIDKLYELLERAEREKDIEAAAALRWAIFQLEK